MSLLNSLKIFWGNLTNSFSTAVERHTDPAERLRAIVRNVADKGPGIKAALSGVVAHYHQLEVKEDQLSKDIAGIKVQMGRAAEKENNQVGQLLAGQLVEKQAKLKQVQVDLVAAASASTEAKQKFEEWNTNLKRVRDDAMAKIDMADRAAAQETMNEAFATIRTTDVTSEFNAASAKIEDRMARANAVTELDTDPAEAKLREFERDTATSDASAIWESFKKEKKQPAAV